MTVVFNEEYFLHYCLNIYSSQRFGGKLIIVYSKEYILFTRISYNFVEENTSSTLCSKQIEFLFDLIFLIETLNLLIFRIYFE